MLTNSAVGVVCIALAMTFSLTSCQHGDNSIDQLTGANTAHKASDKDRLSSIASANNELIRHRQERQRKIDSVRAHPRIQQMVASMDELSRHVAMVLENRSAQTRLYELCNQKFDGESNVLWKALSNDTRMQNILGKNWINSIKDIARNKGSRRFQTDGSIERAIAEAENVTDMPIHLFWSYPEKWDKTAPPLVGFALPSIDSSIIAYDSKGQQHTVDATTAKKQPVIVITLDFFQKCPHPVSLPVESG